MSATGAFTEQVDLIQVLLAAFGLYFAGLVFYLRREDKREGYPLVGGRRRGVPVIGWPAPPPAKTYRLMEGGTAQVPHRVPQTPLESIPPAHNGRPLGAGDPLTAALGAGAFVMRDETPMRTLDGDLLLAPLRRATAWSVGRGEVDPRGMAVLGRDFERSGIVVDLWVDRAAKILRYLEVALLNGSGRVLVPIYHCAIDAREGEVRVTSLKAAQLPLVPRLADAEAMTPREEDRINAFHAGGTLYADPPFHP